MTTKANLEKLRLAEVEAEQEKLENAKKNQDPKDSKKEAEKEEEEEEELENQDTKLNHDPASWTTKKMQPLIHI